MPKRRSPDELRVIAKAAIEQAKAAVLRELGHPTKNMEGFHDILPRMLQRFDVMLADLDGAVAVTLDRGRWFTRGIVDSWPHGARLGELVIEAEMAYEQVP